MFWRDANLVLDSYQVDQSASISGIVQLSVPVSTTEDADILIDTTMTTSDGITITTVAFDVQGVGQATIAPLPVPCVGTPLTVTLDELTDFANIFIGNKSRPATQYQFNLALKDRHGMAWAAFSPDNRVDLYIGHSVGLASSITGEPLSDELFIQNGDRFSAIDTSTVGFDKRGCPARQVGLVDFNSDNLVDIYVVCARNTPNQLYAQIEPGRFEEVASVAGLALEEGGVFRWVDGDVDGDPDLFWASENGFRFFKNESGIFSASLLTDRRLGVQKLAVADYDRDGDPDIFAAASDGNLLFQNMTGNFTVVNPVSLGLPAASMTASWVDFDNDGTIDLYLAPQGLYRQIPGLGKFELSTLLSDISFPETSWQARSAWFDSNMDGRRDFLVTYLDKGRTWLAVFYANQVMNDNHWLEVDVINGKASVHHWARWSRYQLPMAHSGKRLVGLKTVTSLKATIGSILVWDNIVASIVYAYVGRMALTRNGGI